MPCPNCKDLPVPERILCPCTTPVHDHPGCVTEEEAKRTAQYIADLSRHPKIDWLSGAWTDENSLYNDTPWVKGPVNTAEPGTAIPIAEGSFFDNTYPISLASGELLAQVEYVDPEVYSAVGFRVVLNPGNIHCITASSPELAQRVADLLNRDGWNAKKAKLQEETPSGSDTD